ncbi:MAG: hypothetical protein M1826_003289 [Phylliscum demangeonii]|nr:MAG: hypothetical protein M1826_003289 [Phylliscum demangeonii]
MASVTSLDKDLRSMRLSKYTPQDARQVREWIEEVLKEPLPGGELLDVLKDGVVLCKLAKLAIGPSATVKYKPSKMPFVQMENISHFLRALQAPPLSLPDHDVFLTVDLYEAKDPAQVMQCLSAFSRRAHVVSPSAFPRTLGPKARGTALSPQGTGSSVSDEAGRGRGFSTSSRNGLAAPPASSRPMSDITNGAPIGSTTTAPTAARGVMSSWSKKSDEGMTAPAWNISQYGYMGGASQGNQGISFGARRQITSSAPTVPSLAEKGRKRREVEDRRLRQETEEAEREEWEAGKRQRRELERLQAEEENDEEERRRHLLQDEADAPRDVDRPRKPSADRPGLNGQYLSQYLSQQATLSNGNSNAPRTTASESERIRELERELDLARERERKYQAERQARLAVSDVSEQALEESARPFPLPAGDHHADVVEHSASPDRWNELESSIQITPPGITRPSTIRPSFPEPSPTKGKTPIATPAVRPLPDPTSYTTTAAATASGTATGTAGNRTDRFLASDPAPTSEKAETDFPTELGFDQRQIRAGQWASKSLLEREMERERQRQQEWETAQQMTRAAAEKQGLGSNEVTGKENAALRAPVPFATRRQILGPRPLP